MESQKKQDCKCPYICNRHGKCKECQEYHYKSGSSTNCGKSEKHKEPK